MCVCVRVCVCVTRDKDEAGASCLGDSLLKPLIEKTGQLKNEIQSQSHWLHVMAALPAAGLRRAAWRLPPRLCIHGLTGRALLWLPPSAFMARQQGKCHREHAQDDAVPDADVEERKGWCSMYVQHPG